MSAIVKQGQALPSLEKARALLEQCHAVQEPMKLKAIADAVASCAESEAARHEAEAIILLAKARIGELTAQVEEVRPPGAGRGKGSVPVRNTPNRTQRLEAEGLSRKEAAECEKIAKLKKDGDLDRVIDATRPDSSRRSKGKKRKLPASSVVGLHRLGPGARRSAIAKLADKPDVRQAINEAKLESKRALAEEIRANPVVTPDGRYQVIAIDPPWKYDSRAEDTTHRGKNLYPDMTVDAICKLPVASLAQKDCVLWLWTTNAFMRDAYACLDAWGFKEKTILTWDKEIIGLGDWLRNVTEHCILAVCGKPVVSLTNQTTLLREKRREHSRKPESFYSLVDKLCPGSKLEMFARSKRAGWATWGAEVDAFNERESA